MGADVGAIQGVGLPSDRLKLARSDFQGVELTPEDMFVLSRLAGVDLKISELIASSGLPRGRAIAVLSRLLQAGIVANLDAKVEPKPAPPSPPPSVDAKPAPKPEPRAAPQPAPRPHGMLTPLDPEAADLSPALQHELAALEVQVRLPTPCQVLGVSPTASREELEAVFLSMAAKFHPDQYFRRRLGHFKPVLESVFSRITWAYQELLRPPPEQPVSTAPIEASDDLPPLETDLELPDPEPEEAPVIDITGRPRDRFKKALEKQAWTVAKGAIEELERDEPNALDIPKLRAELRRFQNEAEAKALFEKGNALGDKNDWKAAVDCFQKASALDPRNATYVERAGRALLYEGDLKGAKQLAERALELWPESVQARLTLANVFLKAGMERNAKREFEAALKIDPKNAYARANARKPWWKV